MLPQLSKTRWLGLFKWTCWLNRQRQEYLFPRPIRAERYEFKKVPLFIIEVRGVQQLQRFHRQRLVIFCKCSPPRPVNKTTPTHLVSSTLSSCSLLYRLVSERLGHVITCKQYNIGGILIGFFNWNSVKCSYVTGRYFRAEFRIGMPDENGNTTELQTFYKMAICFNVTAFIFFGLCQFSSGSALEFLEYEWKICRNSKIRFLA